MRGRKHLPEEGDKELHQVHDAVVLRESNLLGNSREENRVRKDMQLTQKFKICGPDVKKYSLML